MRKSMDSPAQATTFLTHYFGGCLIDEGRCYVVERFKAMANGEIRRWPGEAPAAKKSRNRPKPEVASVDEVRELRPAYKEIIVCTGLGTRAGVQFWGWWAACSIFGDRRQKR